MKAFVLTGIAFSIGLIMGAFGLHAWLSSKDSRGLPEPTTMPVSRPLEERSYDPARIRSGDPQVRGAVFSQIASDGVTGGIWECTGPAVIEVDFTANEWLYVLEGSVKVDYLDNRFSLNPGDTAFFRAGTTAVWSIENRLKKAWVQQAGRGT